MVFKWRWVVLPVCLSVGAMAADEVWKDKDMAAWGPDEAHALLKDSPWVKTFTPTLKMSQDNNQRGNGGGMGGRRGGGIGMGGRRGRYRPGHPGHGTLPPAGAAMAEEAGIRAAAANRRRIRSRRK